MTDKAVTRAEFVKVNPVPTRKCAQFICEVPEEMVDQALAALGGWPQQGHSRPVAIALLKAETTTAEQTEGTEGWSEAKRRMVKNSGILRNEPAFQDYVLRGWPKVWNHPRQDGQPPEERAAHFIRTQCGVTSCRDLDPDGESGLRFSQLITRFHNDQHGRSDPDLMRQREGGR